MDVVTRRNHEMDKGKDMTFTITHDGSSHQCNKIVAFSGGINYTWRDL